MNEPLSDTDLESLITNGDANDVDEDSVESSSPNSAAQLPQQDVSFFGKIPVNVTLEVASTEIPLKELMDVDTNSVIVLDKLAGEPLDVKVNGVLFAKAEVVVMSGNYSLRIVELSGTNLNDLTQ
jgi:flagellar motor switch protein FliN/FliY